MAFQCRPASPNLQLLCHWVFKRDLMSQNGFKCLCNLVAMDWDMSLPVCSWQVLILKMTYLFWKYPTGFMNLLAIGASSQNLSLHQKQVVGLWLWREKGEKMIDCCGKTLDEWLAAANVEAAGRKILKQNLCTKARFHKRPNCLLPTYHQLLFTRSLGAGGWEVFDDRRTDRRGIAHSSSWISSPFLAAPVQNEVRLHPCSTRAGLTVLNPVLPCWWWENVKCFLQMQQTVK